VKILPWKEGIQIPSDTSILSLLAANLLTIVIAVLEGWDLGMTLFIYWVQSLVIGLFAVLRILMYRTDLITDSPSFQKVMKGKEAGNPALAALAIKIFMAGFFTLHYGFFHFGYYEFLSAFGLLAGVSLTDPYLLLACGAFFAHHAYSFFYHRKNTGPAGKYLQETFSYPYHRIIPLHATIIFGGFVSMVAMAFSVNLSMIILVFFLGVKTVVDVRMHVRKHREEGDSPRGQSSGPDQDLPLD